MADAGESSWGVTLSEGRAGGVPSGTKCHYLTRDWGRRLVTEDQLKHISARTNYKINLKKLYYKCQILNAKIDDNSFATLNTYTANMGKWVENLTQLYFWLYDGTTYLDFYIDGSIYDYLPCVMVPGYDDGGSDGQFKFNSIMLEESGS